jgi:hypothetical protein
MSKKLDLTKQRFGRLTVLYEVYSNGDKRIKWHCVCDCGNKVDVTSSHLRNGDSKSCGCYNLEKITKHGYSKNSKDTHPIYRVWRDIKQRCYNKNNKGYKNYGGRGISMCEEWLNNPKEFIEWCLANGWKQGLEIDRINNDGNYEPVNCRFVTSRENNLNARLLRSTNKSGYRGVHWHKAAKKWQSQIKIDGKQHHLGYFQTKEAAALAYNKKAVKHGYKLNKI